MLVTKEVEYEDGETVCKGFIAYHSSVSKPLPCVMVAHDWGGRGEGACNKARQLAGMGYIGFAIDMYGNAKLGKDKAEKRALMTPFRENRGKLITRINAAFNKVVQLPEVDSEKVAAIGYCFGGLCVLDLIRSGAPLKGVVSFHGVLLPLEGESNKSLNAKVLILHGYDDPLVPIEQVNQFAIEMTERKVDWQVHAYGQTAHSFTDPSANDDEMGLHYNKLADQRSWQSTQLFLQELFACNK
ncbi:dienelactone hydrolase family protein [Legionella sp. PATHC032]|uniref:dienelactone hydrolase family protein n=1 Tax=Legionella sp. PATHC032 TaxID=2992039 RepID=UPI001B14F317|nr:dienelactone hydrolase family protein [Legionella sp. PATHC032]MCW8422624.1 dienelactone hydrolase family protein [Legionella sp. PATHC032]HAZ7572425.1 dienelactone hydrolase family protein [Legionella pneumophila]HBA1635562.1 dienelactone hydrolase family protein [Legionella pneumophila]